MEYNSLGIADVKKLTDMEQVFTGVLSGDAVFFMDGFDQAMKISSAGYPSMGVTEAETGKGASWFQGGLFRFRENQFRPDSEASSGYPIEGGGILYRGTFPYIWCRWSYMEDLVREELLEQVKERLEAVSD